MCMILTSCTAHQLQMLLYTEATALIRTRIGCAEDARRSRKATGDRAFNSFMTMSIAHFSVFRYIRYSSKRAREGSMAVTVGQEDHLIRHTRIPCKVHTSFTPYTIKAGCRERSGMNGSWP